MSAQLRLWSQDAISIPGDERIHFVIRQSSRARRLTLQALPPRTVEVVVPRGTRQHLVREFVRQHQRWIEQAGCELIDAYPDAELRPGSIDLRATGARVALRYSITSAGRTTYRYDESGLELRCRHYDCADFALPLRRWLLAEAVRVLRPWLRREADELGLAPRRIQVRLQKSRWGSCSTRGNISVNAALLLVRPALVRYLFVHELAHLSHMSHSRRYWQAVSRYEPDYQSLDRELAASWRQLPAWLFMLANGASR
jgi:predicted metal-dependent hydrolase